MLRCDLHGPYTPEQAALLVRGEWTPERTGYLCPDCQHAVSTAAKSMADEIDRRVAAEVGKASGMHPHKNLGKFLHKPKGSR